MTTEKQQKRIDLRITDTLADAGDQQQAPLARVSHGMNGTRWQEGIRLLGTVLVLAMLDAETKTALTVACEVSAKAASLRGRRIRP